MLPDLSHSAFPAAGDPISRAVERCGLLRPGECLACEVCCRFPLADSPLAPFFSHEEQTGAAEAGLSAEAFLPGRFGTGGWPLLTRFDLIHRCPAFRPETNDCAIYARRPLDCRLYPFLLMYSPDGDAVTLGLDRYCPCAIERLREPATARLAEEVADLLEGPLLPDMLAYRGLVGGFKEHVEPMRSLPTLTRALCRADLGLARLLPTACERLAPFFDAEASPLSYHSFPSLAIWADLFDLYWKISGDRLLVIADGEGDSFMLCPPLGTGPAAPAAEEGLTLLKLLNPSGASPRIQEADGRLTREIEPAGWRVRESAVEYLYSRAELADLRGNRFESKRQMCNRFERDHAWRFRAYDPEDFSTVMALYRDWLAARAHVAQPPSPAGNVEQPPSAVSPPLRHSPQPGAAVPHHPVTDEFFTAQAEAGFRTLHRSLRDAEALGLRARVLEADGHIVAYTGGYPLADGRTFYVLHEFNDLGVKGAAQVIFREFCREAAPCDRINAGGGSCLAQLDRVKESYHPIERIASHTLVRVQGERREPRTDN